MSLSHVYLKLRHTSNSDSVGVFYSLEDHLLELLANDPIVADVDFELRQLCVDIVLVDAFMRCRIFEGPEVMNATGGDSQ